MPPQPEPEHAVSPVIGTVLLLGIVLFLVLLVLLLCLGFELPHGEIQVPLIFKITNVIHTNENGKMNKASYLVLTNIGKQSYRNRYLFVKLFVNDMPANLNLPTLNGDASCHLHHYGFQNIGGIGSEGAMDKITSKWYPDQTIFINFNDGTFGPGDTLRIEIYDGLTGTIISRDTWPESKKYDTGWFYNHFLNPQAA